MDCRNSSTGTPSDFFSLRACSSLIPSSFYLKKKINLCVDEYDHQEKLTDVVGRLTESVESSLQQLVPEYGPISCHFSFPYDTNSLEQDVRNIYRYVCFTWF